MKKFYMTMAALLCGVAAMAQNEIYCEAENVLPGETGMVAVCVRNTDPFTRIQIQFTEVPEGITFSKKVKEFEMVEDRLDIEKAYLAADDDPADPAYELNEVFDLKRLSNGIIMLAAANAGYYEGGNFVNIAFLGNDGPVLKIPVTVAESVAEAPYTIKFNAKIFSTVSDPSEDVQTLVAQEGTEFTLTVGAGTGITSINAVDSKAPIYNVAGQRVSKAQKGVFIQNGKKVAVK